MLQLPNENWTNFFKLIDATLKSSKFEMSLQAFVYARMHNAFVGFFATKQ